MALHHRRHAPLARAHLWIPNRLSPDLPISPLKAQRTLRGIQAANHRPAAVAGLLLHDAFEGVHVGADDLVGLLDLDREPVADANGASHLIGTLN